MGEHPETPSDPVQPEPAEQPASEPSSEPEEAPMTPEEAATHYVPGPSGEPAPGTVTQEELGSIADGDEIPDSEEEVTQDQEPTDPEAAAEGEAG